MGTTWRFSGRKKIGNFQVAKLSHYNIDEVWFIWFIEVKNNQTVTRGEGGGDSGEKGFQEVL